MSRPRAFHTALAVASLAAVVWGALAFGGVYPWAFTPLAIACALIGVLAMAVSRRGRPPLGALTIALAVIGVAIGLQRVPLPPTLLTRVSPTTQPFLQEYRLSLTLPQSTHAISIAPQKTAMALMLFTAFAVFLLGATRLFSIVGTRSMVRWVAGFGIVLAIIGIVQ